MFGSIRGRIILIVLVLAGATAFLVINGIKLGLDLKGGMYLALEVEDPQNTLTDEARRDATDQALEVIRNRIDQFGVSEPLVQKVGDHRIIVQLPGVRDEERAKAIIERTAFLEFKLVKDTRDFVNALTRIDRAIIAAGGAPASTDTAAADTAVVPGTVELPGGSTATPAGTPPTGAAGAAATAGAGMTGAAAAGSGAGCPFTAISGGGPVRPRFCCVPMKSGAMSSAVSSCVRTIRGVSSITTSV